VTRKIALVLAALILPGGLIALCAAMVLKALQNTARGRKVIDLARGRVPAWPLGLRGAPLRRTA
jgi:hypothetical protein